MNDQTRPAEETGARPRDPLRHDWRTEEIQSLLELPFADLVYQAQQAHRRYFSPNTVQLSTLLNIKSGGCSEDCAYCSQSARHETDISAGAMLGVETVIEAARKAKSEGASRFCMGAAWRRPKDRDMDAIADMISAVSDLGMETCVTLGMLDQAQAQRLRQAGLDYYNHNLDTSPDYYEQIVTTHSFQDRLDTLANVQAAGIRVCSGGIIGMGESVGDRAGLLRVLANLDPHPDSVPINQLVRVEGTPLVDVEPPDELDIVRTIATARILMPRSMLRLSAGRSEMGAGIQALCFLAGANSIFYGAELLTTGNPAAEQDRELLARLGMSAAK